MLTVDGSRMSWPLRRIRTTREALRALAFALALPLAGAAIAQSPASPAPAVELNAARKGIIQNVPTQAPWNGCLLVREGPNTTSPVKGYVPNGATVQIEATDGAWYKISAPQTGYVYGTYVKIVDAGETQAGRTNALTLEEIVIRANPLSRNRRLEERRKLLEDNDTSPLPELPARR